MTSEHSELVNVHQALNAASQNCEDKAKLVTATFKIDPGEKALVDQICKANGTNLSEFLRMCCRGLIADYRG